MNRKEYDKLRHTCGYKGIGRYKIDSNCPKCIAKIKLQVSEEKIIEMEYYREHTPSEITNLDYYDNIKVRSRIRR